MSASASLPERDEALSLRLADEEVTERLFAFHVGRPAAISARASSLAALLRRTPEGKAAWLRAREGNVEPLSSMLFPRTLAGIAPPLVHAIGVWFATVARTLDPREETRVVDAHVRALAAFLHLEREREYLASFAVKALGPIAAREEIATAVERGRAYLADLAAAARAGAPTRTQEARTATMALRSAPRAAAIAGMSPSEERSLAARVEGLVVAVAEEALRPIGEKLEDATARDVPPEQRGALLREVVAAWQFTGFDVTCEQFAADRATPIAWELYRKEAPKNRALLEPLMPLFESLARRVEQDPLHLPYAARCAEIMLFFFELEPTLDAQIRGCERVLAFCPTHHNARMVLAQYLCTKATRAVAAPLLGSADIKIATDLIDRAEKIYPGTSQIEKARARVEEAKAKVHFAGWVR